LPYKIDKGAALQYFCEKIICCERKNSFAFGDSLNDKEMLSAAGKGIIVKNY
jgi:hydroxymethylpyrimidine pyrophosphatase-like HAD family hydrolase